MAGKMAARLFVPDPLGGGAEVTLAQSQTHYLAKVMRLAPGAVVGLFNGRDGEWRARIESLAKRGAILDVEARLREQDAASDLRLIFAPLKKAPLDFLVQKATELVVSTLIPAVTRRTVAQRVNRERMLANAIEAAEQCERLTVPDVRAARPLSDVLDAWPAACPILLCAEAGAAEPIQDVLERIGRAEPCAILIGPEGGFETTELDALHNLPFVTAIGLGPRILRADTAAVAALACWQSTVGDWRLRPSGRTEDTRGGRG